MEPPADPDSAPAPKGPRRRPPSRVGGGLPVDRIPAGKQAVAITVDVQSPAKMTLHQPATVRLHIRNVGTSDALQVRIRDELPDGLEIPPPMTPRPRKVEGTSVLTWTIDTMPGGTEKVIAVQVEPTKPGPLDHGVSVWFLTGSKAQTQVFQPRLKIELHPSSTSVLKGQPVEFKVTLTNVGDGPARKVTVGARLSKGLPPRLRRSRLRRDDHRADPRPGPGRSREIDPLIADANQVDAVLEEMDQPSPNAKLAPPGCRLMNPLADDPNRQPTGAVADCQVALLHGPPATGTIVFELNPSGTVVPA